MVHLIAKTISALGWFTTHNSNFEPRWLFRNKEDFVTLDVLDILADGKTIKEAFLFLAVNNCYFHNGELDEVPVIHEPTRFWRLFGYTKQDVTNFYQLEVSRGTIEQYYEL